MSESIELDADMHDRLRSYQREDETLSETAARVLPAVLPHSTTFKHAGIDAASLDTDTRFVLERWPDDSRMRTWVFDSKTAYLRANKPVIEHTNLERETEGDA
jgi:Ser-tRNA(Ala) deacylase AlaX